MTPATPSTQVPTMPTLSTKVYVANKNGLKEEATVRDLITLGRGKAFETLKKIDWFESFMAELEAEKERPLESLTENLRVARKNAEKARWWMATGLSALTLAPSEEEVREALTEYENARSIWQEVYHALNEATGQR